MFLKNVFTKVQKTKPKPKIFYTLYQELKFEPKLMKNQKVVKLYYTLLTKHDDLPVLVTITYSPTHEIELFARFIF